MAALQVLPAVVDLLKPNGQLLTLIKPQFEAASAQVRGRELCGVIVSGFWDCSYDLMSVIMALPVQPGVTALSRPHAASQHSPGSKHAPLDMLWRLQTLPGRSPLPTRPP